MVASVDGMLDCEINVRLREVFTLILNHPIHASVFSDDTNDLIVSGRM